MILIIEHLCSGFEHVEVNSAIISVIKKAFPNEKITLWGENNHIENVKDTLTKYDLVDNILFDTIAIPRRNLIGIKRLIEELTFIRHTFNYLKKNNIKSVYFLSITSTSLLTLKLVRIFYRNINIYIIPHGILEQVSKKYPKRFSDKLFAFKWIFSFFNYGIKYILLGESLKNELLKLKPKFEKNIIAIELPYFYEKNIQTNSLNTKIRFGIFGVINKEKGSHIIYRLAKDLKDVAEFVLLGFVTDDTLKHNIPENILMPYIDTPMPRSEFDLYAKDVDYALFAYDYANYKLKSSGAFCDAVKYNKPIICFSTPYFEYYFNKYGDIGYLCKDYEEMRNTLKGLAENRSEEKYSKKCDRITELREDLCIESIAKRLSEQINENT